MLLLKFFYRKYPQSPTSSYLNMEQTGSINCSAFRRGLFSWWQQCSKMQCADCHKTKEEKDTGV